MQPTFLPRPQPLQAGLKPVAQSSKAGKRWWQGADGWAFPCHSHIRRTCVCSNSAFHSLSHRAHLLLHVGGGACSGLTLWGRWLPCWHSPCP